MSDPVQKPVHYNQGMVECIDAIESSMSPEEFVGYLRGNAQKYLWRYRMKGKPIQDLDKAIWYINYLREYLILSAIAEATHEP